MRSIVADSDIRFRSGVLLENQQKMKADHSDYDQIISLSDMNF